MQWKNTKATELDTAGFLEVLVAACAAWSKLHKFCNLYNVKSQYTHV